MDTIREKAIGEKFCQECGEVIRAKAELCPKCGVRQPLSPDQLPFDKSKTTAILLALFLGGLGFHKFYLDRPMVGLAYLLLCWTFIPAIIALMDAIVLASMNDGQFRKAYQLH